MDNGGQEGGERKRVNAIEGAQIGFCGGSQEEFDEGIKIKLTSSKNYSCKDRIVLTLDVAEEKYSL